MAQVRRKNTEVLEYIQIYPIEALECRRFILFGTQMKMKEDPTIRNIIEVEEAASFQEKCRISRVCKTIH